MKVKEFIAQFENHPIMFIGTGISLRYLKNSYTWDSLLRTISFDLKGNNEYYLDIISSCYENSKYRFDKIASLLELEFNSCLKSDRNGKFKDVNDIFFQEMEKGINLSGSKNIYI